MQSLIEQHLADRQHQQPDTQAMRRRRLQAFATYCAAQGLELENVTREHLETYQRKLLWSPAGHGKLPSAATVYQGMTTLRQFFRWCVAQEALDSNPTAGWVFGRPTYGEKRLLSRQEVDAILNRPGDSPIGLRDRVILGIFAELGLFGRDCHFLDLADLDLGAYRLKQLRLSPVLTEHLNRYLHKARPSLLTNPDEKALLLTRDGDRITNECCDMVLLRHSPGHRVSPRVLRRSWMAHREAFLSRHLSG